MAVSRWDDEWNDEEVEVALRGATRDKTFMPVWAQERERFGFLTEAAFVVRDTVESTIDSIESTASALGSLAIGTAASVVGSLTSTVYLLPQSCLMRKAPPPHPGSPPLADGLKHMSAEQWTRNVPLRATTNHTFLLDQLQKEAKMEHPCGMPTLPKLEFHDSIRLTEPRLRELYGLKPKDPRSVIGRHSREDASSQQQLVGCSRTRHLRCASAAPCSST